MLTTVQLDEISIRNTLQPGDLGYIIYLHGILYKQEFGYGIAFEVYVAKGLHEFITNYSPGKDAIWICEHKGQIVGFLLLVDRGNRSAQLRYFILAPAYRGIGLGKKLMNDFLQHLKSKNFNHAYLWTTHEQEAAAGLYKKTGFTLSEEKSSTTFGKPLREQRYDLHLGGKDQ